MNILQFIRLTSVTLQSLANQWLSADYFRRYQRKKLKEILVYSFQFVPLYKEISQQLKITVSDISSIEDLKHLPVITKTMIQENPESFLSLKGDRARWFDSKSSGSTGEPLKVFFDPHCWIKSRYALKLRSLFAMGFPVWGKIVVVRVVEPQKLKKQWESLRLPIEAVFKRRRYLSTFESVEDHLQFYREFKPNAIQGPPFYFRNLAEAIRKAKRGPLRVPLVLCVSELLDQQTRTLIDKYLGAEVFDIYGCSEFKDIAWECTAHDGYHIHADNLIVEIAEEGKPVPVGLDGDILLTTLTNRAMPLIRYKVGDRGALSGHKCSCGRGLPMMKIIEGRAVDFIKLPNGEKISPYGAINMLEEVAGLQRFQIFQKKDFSLDVSISATDTSEHNKTLLIREVEDILRQQTEHSIAIRCKFVDQIKVNPGEKCRFVQSELSTKEI